MNKSALRTGYMVEFRNGTKHIVMLNVAVGDPLHPKIGSYFVGTGERGYEWRIGWMDIDLYTDDLRYADGDEKWDVAKVYRSNVRSVISGLQDGNTTLVWERKEVQVRVTDSLMGVIRGDTLIIPEYDVTISKKDIKNIYDDLTRKFVSKDDLEIGMRVTDGEGVRRIVFPDGVLAGEHNYSHLTFYADNLTHTLYEENTIVTVEKPKNNGSLLINNLLKDDGWELVASRKDFPNQINEIDGYEVNYHGNYVTVGCQKIPLKNIENILSVFEGEKVMLYGVGDSVLVSSGHYHGQYGRVCRVNSTNGTYHVIMNGEVLTIVFKEEELVPDDIPF